MNKLRKRTVAIVLFLCVGMSFSVALAKIDDMGLDTTTNTDPNFDPLSSFDAEILDALRDAPPDTRIDYDPVMGTVTIPDQDASSSEIIAITSPYVAENFAVTPTAPIDSSEISADADNVCFNTTNTDPDFDPLSSFDAEILDTLRDVPPDTRIDYDPVTDTVTIPDQDAISEVPVLQTDGYIPVSDGTQEVVSGNGEGDQRIEITNVGVYPYAATVYLKFAYADGTVARASGAFVGPNIILTAGHVVYSHDHGWMKALMAKPGGVNSNINGILTASWSSVKGWVQDHNENYDYGVIVVNNSPGVGYYGMKTMANNAVAGPIYCYGYPCDKPNKDNPRFGTLWYSPGNVYAFTPSLIYHTADTYGCDSGGPIVKQNDYTSIIAIHTGSQNSICNRSVRITSDIIRFVQGF